MKSKPPGSAPADVRRTGKPGEPELSTARKLIFGFVGFVLLPLLALGLVEVGLRVAGVGYDPSFFKALTINGEKFVVENDRFGLRFFPPELARSPAPIVFKAKKEPGVTRIFVLGESAALGDPRPSFGAGRYLQALLRERYPEGRFEVIHAAVTAINSHALVPIARECARYDGDLWVLYIGNNEMVGPFGATTVLGSQAPPLLYVRFSLAAQSTRLGQLIMAAGRKLAGDQPKPGGWGGMRMWVEHRIPPGDPRKEVVYRNFGRNYERILRIASGANVPVVFNTVSVNLRDCAPFASVRGELTTEQQARFEELWENARRAEAAGEGAAAPLYEALAQLDPGFAEAQFRLARTALRAGQADLAQDRFSRARDVDALPFRTDRRQNEIIRKLPTGSGAVFIDAEAQLAAQAAGGIPGRDYFFEHVHFNFDGNYALARLWAESAVGLLPAGAKGGDRGGWASQADCERRLGLTDWNRHEVLAEVLSRLGQAPFTNQSSHAEEVAAVRARIRETRSQWTNQSTADARQVYTTALAAAPGDHRMHENFAEFLELTGAVPEAAEQWEEVRRLIPHHHSGHFHSGRLNMRLRKLPEAEERLRAALALRPDLAEAWLVLGQTQALKPDPQSALVAYRRAQTLAPGDARVYYHMGQALAKLGQRAEAVESFTLALRMRPQFWEARYALGEELAFSRRPAEARAQFEQVLQVNPLYPMAHFNLGVALIELKDYERALKHLEEAARLDPANAQAQAYAERVRQMIGRP